MTITPANLIWQGNQPKATQYDDIYFSTDAQAECLRAFIEPSGILARAKQQASVCVGELGFGTGLNFATLADTLLKQTQTQLRFISFEKHPLRPQDWQQVLRSHGKSLPIYEEIVAHNLSLVPGWQHRVYANGRVMLSLYHGEVETGLADLDARQVNPVDAWFLDGFAPDKNPAMWTPTLFEHVAALSDHGTSVTTFTAAGRVRRGLNDVGFRMHKVDQRPLKRESLAGVFEDGSRPHKTPPKTIHIHGAGLGGACMARYLAESTAETEIHVYDPKGIASEASSIDAAIMHSRLLSDGSADADLRVAAFHFASHYLSRFRGFESTGVLQVTGPNLSSEKLHKLNLAYGAEDPDQHDWIEHLSASDASALSGLAIDHNALHFPTGGIVHGPNICQALLAHPKINIQTVTPDQDADATHLLCTAQGTRAFAGCEHLEISPVWGQLDWFAADQPLGRTPLVGNGYFVPRGDACVLGASYEYEPWEPDDATHHNQQLNAHYLANTKLTWQRRVRGPRAVTSDRIPIIGSLDQPEGSRLWLATAFGSQGTTAAPLSAAIIVNTLLGWLPPVDPHILHLVRPQRFAERQARRGIRHIN